ncbi:MAG: phosphatidate phosphatase App1 family protein, partial [Nannocystaceae bacterium]
SRQSPKPVPGAPDTSTPVSAPPAKQLLYPAVVHRRSSPIKSDETVVLFPSLAQQSLDGQSWQVPIHGWIFEWEGDDFTRNAALYPLQKLLEDDPAQAQTLKRRARWFLVDNERGKTVSVTIGGREIETEVSARDGHFFAQVTLSAAELGPHIQGDVVVMSAVMKPGDQRRFAGLVHLVAPRGRLLISDIDDTIRDSHVTDKTELLRRTFLKPFTAATGMPDFLRSHAQDPGTHLHFVSASPWQLYPLLAEFLDHQKIVQATFSLKRIRIKDQSVLDLLADPLSTKVATIEALLRRFPQRSVILVGDSGERDPEVYGELARRFPDQIEHIYVRLAPGSALDDARQATAFAGVAASKWSVFTNPPPR